MDTLFLDHESQNHDPVGRERESYERRYERVSHPPTPPSREMINQDLETSVRRVPPLYLRWNDTLDFEVSVAKVFFFFACEYYRETISLDFQH